MNSKRSFYGNFHSKSLKTEEVDICEKHLRAQSVSKSNNQRKKMFRGAFFRHVWIFVRVGYASVLSLRRDVSGFKM